MLVNLPVIVGHWNLFRFLRILPWLPQKPELPMEGMLLIYMSPIKHFPILSPSSLGQGNSIPHMVHLCRQGGWSLKLCVCGRLSSELSSPSPSSAWFWPENLPSQHNQLMQSPHSNLPTQKTEFENLRSTKSSVANLKESKRSQLANVLTKFTRSFCKLYLTYPYVTYDTDCWTRWVCIWDVHNCLSEKLISS
jgi:hypothetical protein